MSSYLDRSMDAVRPEWKSAGLNHEALVRTWWLLAVRFPKDEVFDVEDQDHDILAHALLANGFKRVGGGWQGKTPAGFLEPHDTPNMIYQEPFWPAAKVLGLEFYEADALWCGTNAWPEKLVDRYGRCKTARGKARVAATALFEVLNWP